MPFEPVSNAARTPRAPANTANAAAVHHSSECRRWRRSPYRQLAMSTLRIPLARSSSSPRSVRAKPRTEPAPRDSAASAMRSHSSTASQRSSIGTRFHWPQGLQTTQSRPFEESNAIRRPTAKCGTSAFLPSDLSQRRQCEYTVFADRESRNVQLEMRGARAAPYVLYETAVTARVGHHNPMRGSSSLEN